MTVQAVLASVLALAMLPALAACSVTIGDKPEPTVTVTVRPSASPPAAASSSNPSSSPLTNGSAAPSPSAALVLRADGSGDAADLTAAVAAVPDGGVISLEAGTYLLDAPLKTTKSFRLVGAGREDTEIETAVRKAGLVVVADEFGAEGITFRHSGSRPGGCVVVADADVRIVDCAFVGSTREGKWAYEALWIKGRSLGYVRDCVFKDNAAGLGLSGYTRTSVEECSFTDCDVAGIAVYGYATSHVLRNVCKSCNDSGIAVSDSAHPLIDSNRCTGCEDGIACGGQAAVKVQENRCSDNLADGIVIYGKAHATVTGNVCMGNRESGIAANGTATVRILDNTTERNEGVGIGCWGRVTGRVVSNDVKRNGSGKSGGICLGGHANLLITDNVCKRNHWYGILFRDDAGGVARDNQCAHSAYGIIDNSSRTPTLTGNDLQWNSRQNIGRW